MPEDEMQALRRVDAALEILSRALRNLSPPSHGGGEAPSRGPRETVPVKVLEHLGISGLGQFAVWERKGFIALRSGLPGPWRKESAALPI